MLEARLVTQDLAVSCGDTINPGEIQFYQAILPPLSSGNYRLVVNQEVQLPAETPKYEHLRAFSVDGPRFTLTPGTVQQVFPPANLAGDYERSLPHVVFTDPTLPWTRTIDGSVPAGDDVPPPWVALLTLYPEELVSGGAPIEVKQMTLDQLLTPSATVIPPNISKSQFTPQELTQNLLAVELPQSVFSTITPTINDLPYLAHARLVNTDGKEILGLNADGYFSLAVGNRLPKAGATNTVYLVSLEGQGANIRGGSTQPSGKSVRVVVLASWQFTARAARGDFLQILQNVSIDLLQFPFTPFEGNLTREQTLAKMALQVGYVPLFNNTRSGETTTSWYRGPGSPAPTKVDALAPYQYADNVIRYDPGPDDASVPGTGVFDQSYACAWQIGRLLGLSDAAFARQLFEWRRAYQQYLNELALLDHLTARLESFPGISSLQATRLQAAGPELAAKMWLAAAAGLAEEPRVIRHEHRSDAELPGVVPREELAAKAAGLEDDDAGGDPLFALLDRVFGGDRK
ncbi:MAG TPA: hypothetical protein VF432_23130 [Thermoanaerobaculia bacterium]